MVDFPPVTGPLEGIRVIDLCRLLPGAFATRLLADMGADVIKVEQPGGGDPMRAYTPRIGSSSGYTWVTDRGKRSVALNLRDPAGAAAALRLMASADVVVESFRPGVAERLGVGYPQARAVNGAVVYASLSGYGADGPRAQEAGHDINYLGRAGVLGVTGTPSTPVISGVQIADVAGGSLLGLAGLLAALVRAQRTGEGDHVDIAMADGAFALQALNLGARFAGGPPPRRGRGLLTGGVPCYNVYACADGRHLTVGALEAPFWRTLCETLGREDLIASQMDSDAIPVWRELFASRPRDEWLAACHGVDACIGPVNDLDEAIDDPQLRARGMVEEISHPTQGPHLQLGTPLRFAEHRAERTGAAPELGNATREVLAETGFTEAEVEALIAGGSASDADPIASQPNG
jgi:alpha-methylacyl-CoA racemase